MSDFALTFLYVVPSANSIPTTGSTDVLTAGQTGIYLPTFAAATAGTIPSVSHIYIAQGRSEKSIPSLRSDKIASSKVTNWTKTVGSASASNEVWELSEFEVPVGQSVTVSFNLHSYYLDTAFYNGYTKSITVKPECLDCGDDPCTLVANETVIDAILAALNMDPYGATRTTGSLTQFLVFQKFGTGDSASIVVTGKPLTETSGATDLSANPYQVDRLWFRPTVYISPDTTADFIAPDKCATAATVVLKQRSTYPKLIYAEVVQLEKDYYSYKVDRFKDVFADPGFNPLYESYAEAGVVYNQYDIDYLPYDNTIDAYNGPFNKQLYRVVLLVPNTITNIETILTAYLGAPTTVSGSSPTTTTTTSTTSTTTTSTTTLLP